MRPISIGYVPALAIPNIETMCEMLRKYVTKHTFICPCLYACMSVAMHVHTYMVLSRLDVSAFGETQMDRKIDKQIAKWMDGWMDR